MNKAKVSYISESFTVTELNHPGWQSGEAIHLDRYWSGAAAEPARQSEARLLWNDEALFVRFTGCQAEPLIVSPDPDVSRKTDGLWERDVFEIFIAPHSSDVSRYFEFEVAPTGEWLDLALRITPGGARQTNFDYESGMQVAADVRPDRVRAAIRIEWRAFGTTPEPGTIWRGNLFRCIGAGAGRGYLAWQPTGTEKPNFHVPEKFGQLEFL